MARDAQEQLRMTGNLNSGFEEEVKLGSILSHCSASPINTISGAIRSSKLLIGVESPTFKQDNKMAHKEMLLCTYLSLKSRTVLSRGSGLVVV